MFGGGALRQFVEHALLGQRFLHLWYFFQVSPPPLRAAGTTATAARVNEETAPNATGNDADGAAAAVPPSMHEARAFPLVINFITPDLSTRSNKGLTRVERNDSYVSPTPPSYAEKGSPLGEPIELTLLKVPCGQRVWFDRESRTL